MKKSLKIKIAISVIWGVIAMLIAGGGADGYSGFKFSSFLGILVALNLPTLLYWLGFWIWGEGYIIKLLLWPLSPVIKGDGFLRRFLLLHDPNQKRPWRRFWARWADYFIWGLVISYTLEWAVLNLGLILPESFDNQAVWSILIVATWAAIEPFFISFWSATPGKWMLGIKVLRENGDKLSLSEATYRSGQVWLKGMALGFPIFNLFTTARSRAKLMNTGSTSWDAPNGNQVIVSKPSFFGIIVFVCVLASFPYVMYEAQRVEQAMWRFEQQADKYPEKCTEILTDYLNQVSKTLENKFTPEHFSGGNGPWKKYQADASKQALAKANTLLNTARSNFDQTYVDFENEFRRLDMPESYQKAFFKSYNNEKAQSRLEIDKFFQTEKAILNLYERLLLFLDQNKNKYIVENNQFLFETDEELNEFNAIMAELNELAAKEQEFIKKLNGLD